jgi:hypothetical protein
VCCTARACPQRPEGAPATSRSDEVSGSANTYYRLPGIRHLHVIGYYYSYDTVEATSVLRFIFFLPPTPELTISFCSITPTVLYNSCVRAYMHMAPVFIRSTGILLINSFMAKHRHFKFPLLVHALFWKQPREGGSDKQFTAREISYLRG